MGVIAATLQGKRVTSARVTLPAWGCWYAEANLDGEVTLTGRVELKIADLTLSGTVLSGGPAKGRSAYRIAGGAAQWGKVLPKKSYANDLGVKASTVLTDAAREAGETLDASTIPTTALGPSYVRPEGPASAVLERISPTRWYVGEDGVTRIGQRAASALPAKVTRVTPVDRARERVDLASDTIAAIVPGVVVDGLEAIDVEHAISSAGALRSTVWGKLGAETSRRLAAWRALFEQLDPFRRFRGVTEYRVVTQEGERLNLQAVRVSTGMPDVRRAYVRPGIPGARADVALGTRVLVTFVDADPARPVVVGFEDADGEGFTPLLTEIDATTFVKLGAGTAPAIKAGDLAGGIWPCVPTQAKVLV